MASLVQIANRALSRLGARRVLSLSDDTAAARAVNDAWEMVREEVLRAHSWNCVAKRAELAELSEEPAFGYAHQYQAPTDCLRVLEVLSGDGETPTTLSWVVESRVILTDESAPLKVRYVRNETDTTQYDALLSSLMAARLAVEICEELTQSNTKMRLAVAWHERLSKMAMRADGEEQSVMELVDDVWVTSRF